MGSESMGRNHLLDWAVGVRMNLWTLILVLIILWALGIGTGAAGGLIHLLLVIALIVVVVQLISRGRVE